MKLSLPSSFILAATTLQAGSARARLFNHERTASKGDKINVPSTPTLPGVSNSGPTPKVILAQATNYPPYTGIGPNLELTGFGPDFARGIEEVCNIDVTLVETRWSQCWGSNDIGEEIGQGLLAGHYHGCTTYTGTKGVRQRYLEFSAPILEDNKAAGILTRLVDGVPVVNGESSLDGLNVGDVVGWAPTADVLAISMNQCTGETFSGFTLVPNTPGENNANDFALKQLLSGDIDALWIYADQAAKFNAECAIDSTQEWDCEVWGKLGEDFAYVQTGIYDYAESGTTLAISKKGSGLADTLNPCIEAFIKTESYKNLCVKYELENDCFTNEFFDETSNSEVQPYSLPTSDLTTSCAGGYCPCPSSRRGL